MVSISQEQCWLVYRIENKYGMGPFTSCDDLAHFLTDMHKQEGPKTGIMRTPADDEGLTSSTSGEYNRWYMYFGFASIEQMLAYFGYREDILSEIASHGYGVSIYRVLASAVIEGTHQLCFYKHYAEKIETISILNGT